MCCDDLIRGQYGLGVQGCSEEQPCAEPDVCAPHSYSDAEDNWHLAGDFCVAEEDCHGDVTDLGRTYTADCVIESTLVRCETDAECIEANDDTWLCAPFSVA